MSTNKNWKNLERKIAKDIGGKRILGKGMSLPDVEKDNIIIEAKHRKVFSINKSIEQVEGYRKSKEQILVVCHREINKQIEVFMTVRDLYKLIKKNKNYSKIVIQLRYKDFVNMCKGGMSE